MLLKVDYREGFRHSASIMTDQATPSHAPTSSILPGLLEKTLRDILHLKTFETRNLGELDFSDQAVWSLLAACEKAYQQGRIDGVDQAIRKIKALEDKA